MSSPFALGFFPPGTLVVVENHQREEIERFLLKEEIVNAFYPGNFQQNSTTYIIKECQPGLKIIVEEKK